MRDSIRIILISLTFTCSNTFGQTVGTIINSSNSWQGYTLMSALSDSTTYLFDNCGQIVNEWESTYTPGNNAFIDESGNLYRAGKTNNAYISNGGNGGAIEKYDWDNNLLWTYILSDSIERLHHDFELMPNGNILAITWEKKDSISCIQAGRDPLLLTEGEVWIDKVIEIEPVGTDSGTVVWEWSAWDHLVQDYDNSVDNFGVVASSPRKLNINAGESIKDWMHCNALDYNAEKDLIVLSSPEMNEVYIIDHSTTNLESQGSIGGNYGLGGDFLFRWGNPSIYGQGISTDQELFYQHDIHWVKAGLSDAGKLMLFNNRLDGGTKSAVYVINPDTTSIGEFELNGGVFGLSEPFWSYDLPVDLTSNILSGAQRLPNGNTLIASGRNGRYIEIDPLGTIVWRYASPVSFGGVIMSQGDVGQSQFIFNARRYSEDFQGFVGKDLTPGNKIELNPIDNCTVYNNGVSLEETVGHNFVLYPNPVNSILTIVLPSEIEGLSILDVNGREVFNKVIITEDRLEINVKYLNKGIYFAMFQLGQAIVVKKFVVN